VSVAIFASIVGILFAVGLGTQVLRQASGRDDETELHTLSKHVSDGVRTFLEGNYAFLTVVLVVICLSIGPLFGTLEVLFVGPQATFDEAKVADPDVEKLDFLGGLFVVVSILLGALLSATAGWFSATLAAKANSRTVHACRESLGAGMNTAYGTGAVAGMSVASLSLGGLLCMYLAFSLQNHPWSYLSGFGLGASAAALCARVGGGVYANAADVGADLVGKYESSIPADDKRNPAVIADAVGNTVGDLAGMGADLFESYAGAIIAACSLAAVYQDLSPAQASQYAECRSSVDDPTRCIYAVPALGKFYSDDRSSFIYAFEYCPNMYTQQAPTVSREYFSQGYINSNFYSCEHYGLNGQYVFSLFALPFWIAGVGILSSIAGIFVAHAKDATKMTAAERKVADGRDELEQLEHLLGQTRKGMTTAAVLSLLLSLLVTYILFFGSEGHYEWRLWGCMIIGLAAGLFIGLFSEYCTSYSYGPVAALASASESGAAAVIIHGLGIGLISCAIPTLILVVTILASEALADVYGIAIAAVGMLSVLSVTLATDAYGAVADNASGLAEMASTVEEHVRERTDALDALGDSTAATGKGFAIGSAVLTSVGLITAYMDQAGLTTDGGEIDLKIPVVISGLLLGAMLPYVFAALTVLSVSQTASAIVLQARLQFTEASASADDDADAQWFDHFDPAGRPGKEAFEWYRQCIAVATSSSLRELVVPSAVALLFPLVVGFILGSAALAGLLIGALASCLMLASMMDNAGSAWGSARKYVELGRLGKGKGKNSPHHAAATTADTAGNPFSDTAGPSLHVLVTLISLLSLVLSPVFYVIYRSETLPFVGGGADGSVDWVGPVVGVIIMAVMIIVIAVAQHLNDKFYAGLKKTVEDSLKSVAETKKAAREAAKEVAGQITIVGTFEIESKSESKNESSSDSDSD
jgi:Na+/H+-translocating membrane pyrophosphatase